MILRGSGPICQGQNASIWSIWQGTLPSNHRYSCLSSYSSLAHSKEDRLPKGATQLAIVAASDKTCITAMTGSLEMYLAYLSLVNIISKVCMKASNHAWMCFCFIPIVKFKVHSSFQSILSARLWHACVDMALARCKEAAKTGCFMADPSGRLCWSFPLLAAWIHQENLIFTFWYFLVLFGAFL